MRIAIAVQRLGPYHAARMRAAARLTEVACVEFFEGDRTYAWDRLPDTMNVPRHVCFGPERARVGARELRARIFEVLSAIGPDAVAIPGWSSPSAIHALQWCRLGGVPAVVMSDSIEHNRNRVAWKEWAKSRIVRNFSSALVAGAPQREYVVKLGLPASHVFPGYDVIDNDHFIGLSDEARLHAQRVRAERGLPSRYFLNISRFIEEKNLPRLLDAYARYRQTCADDSWDLVLAGDGPLRDALVAKARALRIESKVHFAGFRQYEELPVYYGLASAFVHSSTSETWGLVINEAMACALPVIVSDRCGCVSDLVREGVNGVTFDPLDVDGLARRMIDFTRGSMDLGGMGAAARETIMGWGCDLFAANLLEAVKAAQASQMPRAAALDVTLLGLVAAR